MPKANIINCLNKKRKGKTSAYYWACNWAAWGVRGSVGYIRESVPSHGETWTSLATRPVSWYMLSLPCHVSDTLTHVEPSLPCVRCVDTCGLCKKKFNLWILGFNDVEIKKILMKDFHWKLYNFVAFRPHRWCSGS